MGWPRILVDKTPAYALDPGALLNAERGFDQPIYIHLIRDPSEMVRSFESMHMDQVLYLKEHRFSSAQLGELVWLLSHRNIIEFLDEVPAERQHRVRFEDLVTEPRRVMQQLSDALDLPFNEGLVRPYDDLDRKMVDGIHRISTPNG